MTNSEKKLTLEQIIEYSMWSNDTIQRALSFAAYHNDLRLVTWVTEDARVDQHTMEAMEWQPLFVAARNNSLQVVRYMMVKFGAPSKSVRNTMMAEAIVCNATRIVGAYANGAELEEMPQAIHTAITFNYADTLHLIFKCQSGVTLDHLHDTGIIQRLVDHKMWPLLKLVARE